jgi:hypothetical protein
MTSAFISKLEGLVKPVEQAAEQDVAPLAATVFDSVWVDIRAELPGLVAKLGVNTSDESSVIHGFLILVVELLQEYGPAEIRDALSSDPAAAPTPVPAASAGVKETPAK